MLPIRTLIASASLLAIAGFAQAQQAPDATKPNPTAATTTGTSTSQSEMNRGVPGVNVDVGNKASNGVVSADVDKNTDTRNLTDRSGTTAAGEPTRAARSDRN
jgi:hypothetical protein